MLKVKARARHAFTFFKTKEFILIIDSLGSSLFVSTATCTPGGLLSVFRDFVSAQKKKIVN